MALSGSFTFKKNETIDCPISIDNTGGYAAQKLIVKITINPQAGILTSSTTGSVVGVHHDEIGVFYVVGTATQINTVLQTLRYQHKGPFVGYTPSVELRAYDDGVLVGQGGNVVSGVITLSPYQWPAVSWNSTPQAVFSVPTGAAQTLVRLPTVSDSGVGLLSAIIEPIDQSNDGLGKFVVPEASRDKGEIGTTTASPFLSVTRFSGNRAGVNAWLQSIAWKNIALVSEAKYKITVTDGRTNSPAVHFFTLARVPGITVASETVEFANATPKSLGLGVDGIFASGTTTFQMSIGLFNGTFSKTQASYGSVTPVISSTSVTITGTVQADIVAAIQGIRFVPNGAVASQVVNFTLSPAGASTQSGSVVVKQKAISVTNLNQGMTITEDAAIGPLGSSIVVDGPTGLTTYTYTLKVPVSPVRPATLSTASSSYGAATVLWNSGTGILTVIGNVLADVNTALAAIRITLLLNYDKNFVMESKLTSNNGYSSTGSIPVTVTPVNDPWVLNGLNGSGVTGENIVYSMLGVSGTQNGQPTGLSGLGVTCVDTTPAPAAMTVTLTLMGTTSAKIISAEPNSTPTAGYPAGWGPAANSGTWTAGTKTWTVTASGAAMNAFLSKLVYVPGTNEIGTRQISTNLSYAAYGSVPAGNDNGVINIEIFDIDAAPKLSAEVSLPATITNPSNHTYNYDFGTRAASSGTYGNTAFATLFTDTIVEDNATSDILYATFQIVDVNGNVASPNGRIGLKTGASSPVTPYTDASTTTYDNTKQWRRNDSKLLYYGPISAWPGTSSFTYQSLSDVRILVGGVVATSSATGTTVGEQSVVGNVSALPSIQIVSPIATTPKYIDVTLQGGGPLVSGSIQPFSTRRFLVSPTGTFSDPQVRVFFRSAIDPHNGAGLAWTAFKADTMKYLVNNVAWPTTGTGTHSFTYAGCTVNYVYDFSIANLYNADFRIELTGTTSQVNTALAQLAPSTAGYSSRAFDIVTGYGAQAWTGNYINVNAAAEGLQTQARIWL